MKSCIISRVNGQMDLNTDADNLTRSDWQTVVIYIQLVSAW